MPLRTTRRRLAALLAAAAACACVRARAEETAVLANPSIAAVNNSVSLSYLGSSLYYIEPDNGTGFGSGYNDSEKGNQKGARLAMTYMGWDDVYFHAQYSGVEGKANYDGFTLLPVPGIPVNTVTRETFQEIDARVGMGFSPSSKWVFTPFLAGGRRYWVREIGWGTPGDFVESYSIPYIGVGNLIQYSPSERWVLDADFTVARTFAPSINVPGAGLNGAQLGSGPFIDVGAEVDYRVAGAVHLFAGVEYLYYNFWQSGVQASGFLEPVSRTEIYSATAGLRLSWGPRPVPSEE